VPALGESGFVEFWGRNIYFDRGWSHRTTSAASATR
jgi:hypothetical protein